MTCRSITSCGVALSALLLACVAQPADDVAGPAASEYPGAPVGPSLAPSVNAPGSTFISFWSPIARRSDHPDVYGALVVWGESTGGLQSTGMPTTDRILVDDQSIGTTRVLWEETLANVFTSDVPSVGISEDWVVWHVVRRTANGVSTGQVYAYNLTTQALLVQPLHPLSIRSGRGAGIIISGGRAVFGHSVGPLNEDRRISLWDLATNTVTELVAGAVEASDFDGDRVVYSEAGNWRGLPARPGWPGLATTTAAVSGPELSSGKDFR